MHFVTPAYALHFVTPVYTGVQAVSQRAFLDTGFHRYDEGVAYASHFVTPAYAGVQSWMPAFAGMTKSGMTFHARKLWLIFGWLLVLLVIYLSLAPIAIEVPVDEGDKFGHVAAYAALMFWFANLYETLRTRRMLAIGFVALGVGLEFVQGWTDYRTFEVADMAADALGVAAGWVLAPPRLPNVLQRIERFVGT